MSGIDLAEFYDTFFDEAQELLQNMEETLLGLDLSNPDREALNAIFRAAHSIKGGAATFGAFETLVQTTHKLENVLDSVRNGELALTEEGLSLFLSAKDVLADQVAAYRQAQEPSLDAAHELLEALAQFHSNTHSVNESMPAAEPDSQVAHDQGNALHITFIGVSDKDIGTLKEELSLMGVLSEGVDTPQGHQFTLTCDLDIDTVLAICGFVINDDQINIRKVQSSVEPVNGAGASDLSAAALMQARDAERPVIKVDSGPTKGQAKEGGTIRVPTQRVDVLVNQVGEVVINQSILSQSVNKLDPIEHASLLQGFEHMAGALRSLQESIMALRMVPMDYAFGRYPRVVRETAAKLNKKIELKTVGGATELDKGLIEKMIDPLTHLIRNSLDHGIETPDVRVAKGKSAVGTIIVSAYQEGGRIVIEVADDGAGINREKVIAKAMEKGLQASHAMSDNEAFQLIFQPGFSTADQVTDVSGRGVGMDVVRRNIQEVGGQVRIESAVDKGTTLYISLPLTLAIMDGMSIQVGQECFVMPLSHIVECLQPSQEQLREIAQGGLVLRLRGEHLPVLRLAQRFQIENAIQNLHEAILIVVQVGNDRYALAVDRLLGQHQVVVKSLETHYERVHGTSGATILGNGSVALILDAAQLYSAQ